MVITDRRGVGGVKLGFALAGKIQGQCVGAVYLVNARKGGAALAVNPQNTPGYERHPQAEVRMHSAVVLVKGLLKMPGLIQEHRREFVRLALWKVTEAEGKTKYKTRFQSQEALNAGPGTKFQHEHVFQRAQMADALLAAKPEEIDEILKSAVGCTVTEEEHDRLSGFKDCDGWERYQNAGIVVIDKETGQPLDFASLTKK